MIDEFLRPATDAGAVVQLAAAVTLTIVAGVLLPRRRELQLFAIGLGLCIVGPFALRAVH